MPSKITFNLSGIPAIDSYVSLNNNYFNDLKETFKSTRINAYQSQIGGTLNSTLFALYNSLIADYNDTNLFTILYSLTDSSISIEHPSEYFFSAPYVVDGTGGLLSFTIEDTQDQVAIKFTDVSFQEASTDKCSKIKVVITTNFLGVEYTVNRIEQNVITNPFSIELNRSTVIDLFVKGANGTKDIAQQRIPSKLVSDNISVNYVNSPSGATVDISVSSATLLDLEYSLDGTNWQTSNSYSGILPGDYPSFVRDQYGCVTDFTFTIPDFSEGGVGQRIPYSDLPSKSNSIRFAKYVEWGVCSNYKNDENTLSCQLPYTENALEYNQLFQNCDIITTQIKTNYRDIVSTVISIGEDGEPIYSDIPVVKKSNNSDLKDCRQALSYDLADLGIQTGIYFINGFICDYDTDIPTTETYLLNGNLPQWGVIGNFVYIFNGWHEIVNIVYDEIKSAYVLVINYTYTNGQESLQVVKSVYNLESYDIWEFEINMANFSDRKIQVNITQNDSDSSFAEQVYISEIIDVQEEQEGTLLIEYYNKQNTDIFYATGIKNRIRLPIEFLGGNFTDVTDSEKTDRETYLINAQSYENDLIAFKLMPKQIMRKIIQALSHKFVFLNEVRYVKEDSPEVTNLIGTNQYRVNAQMTKADAVYTSKGVGESFNTGSLEVPSLIELESNGYLKIKQ